MHVVALFRRRSQAGPKVMPRHRITPAARQPGCEAVQARVNKRAADLAPIIAELRAAGITSLNGITEAFNERGIPTAAGRGQ